MVISYWLLVIGTWLCCQLGAREHYAVPRALHQIRQLKVLITDTWINHHHPLNWLPKSYFANVIFGGKTKY